jgi:hypothetical protein
MSDVTGFSTIPVSRLANEHVPAVALAPVNTTTGLSMES